VKYYPLLPNSIWNISLLGGRGRERSLTFNLLDPRKRLVCSEKSDSTKTGINVAVLSVKYKSV
jgi:hypothetical protein